MAATPSAVQLPPDIPPAHPTLRSAPALPARISLAQRLMVRLVDGFKYMEGKSLRLHGFRSRWIPTRHGPMHFLEAGRSADGPTWVFIHGFGSRAAEWGPLLRHWRRHCGRILVVDLLGHGRSSVPPVGMSAQVLIEAGEEALRTALAPGEKCTLVGNSMGGIGAVRMAQRLPDAVHGMVLISPAGAPMSVDEMGRLLEVFAIKTYRQACQFVDKLFNHGVSMRPFMALGAWAHITRPHLRELLGVYPSYPPFTLQELQRMPPTLLIWGAEDHFLPVSAREFFVASLPGGHTQVEMPAGFGHSPQLGRGKAVAELMLSWASQRAGMVRPCGTPAPSGLRAAVRAD